MGQRSGRAVARAAAFAFLVLGCTPSSAQAAAKHAGVVWYASWAASPMDFHSFPANIIAPTMDAVSNQTIRQTVTISRGGSQLRIRFSNEFGTSALRIGSASVAYRGPGPAGVTRIPLTFGGAGKVTAYAGAPVVSDPIKLKVPNGANLEISIYLPEHTPISTIHLLGLQPSDVSSAGDYTMADSLPDAVPFDFTETRSGHKFVARAFLSEVDVGDRIPARTIIAFGDSITDGMGSTMGESRRWPDVLAKRIAQAKLHLSVINHGIGGNQILANGAGVGALGRLDRDVLAVPGASTVILLEGINDIGFSGGLIPGFSRPDLIPAEEIIQSYRELIARCHARGLKVIGATMTPFGGAPPFTPEKEKIRLAVNVWIRTSGAFDAMVDFDRLARDPQQQDRLRSDYDSGDHVHLNDAGYRAMAEAIDLKKL